MSPGRAANTCGRLRASLSVGITTDTCGSRRLVAVSVVIPQRSAVAVAVRLPGRVQNGCTYQPKLNSKRTLVLSCISFNGFGGGTPLLLGGIPDLEVHGAEKAPRQWGHLGLGLTRIRRGARARARVPRPCWISPSPRSCGRTRQPRPSPRCWP